MDQQPFRSQCTSSDSWEKRGVQHEIVLTTIPEPILTAVAACLQRKSQSKVFKKKVIFVTSLTSMSPYKPITSVIRQQSHGQQHSTGSRSRSTLRRISPSVHDQPSTSPSQPKVLPESLPPCTLRPSANTFSSPCSPDPPPAPAAPPLLLRLLSHPALHREGQEPEFVSPTCFNLSQQPADTSKVVTELAEDRC
eukprot:761105-Hanusia_phi.AAC.1